MSRRRALGGMLIFFLLLGSGVFLLRQGASESETRAIPSSSISKEQPKPVALAGLHQGNPEIIDSRVVLSLSSTGRTWDPVAASSAEPEPEPEPEPVPTILTNPEPVAGKNWKAGTVDMAQVFREYHKTREAEHRLNEDKTKAKKELDSRSARQREVGTQLTEIGKILADRLVNEELKRQKQAGAEKLREEYQRLTLDLQEYAARRERQLLEHSDRLRKAILNEIVSHIQEKAKRDGYDIVFDKSGLGISGSPLLLVTRDAMDFTPEVILELNQKAPVARAGPVMR